MALVNAPGTGVADDKAILSSAPTWRCDRPADMAHVLDHLDSLVVKAVNESGGYGMLMGHQSTAQERADFSERIGDNPRNYNAQPVVELSQPRGR